MNAFFIFLSIFPSCTFYLLQISPIKECYHIYVSKNTGELRSTVYIALFTNCVAWTLYSLLILNWPIFVPNSSAVVLCFIYSIVHHKYGTKQDEMRKYYIISLCIIVPLIIVALTVPNSLAASIEGYSGMVLAMCFTAAPLLQVKQVIEEKSTRSMSFPMAITTTVNATAWTMYGWIVINDIVVVIPNIVGALMGICQVMIFCLYEDKKLVAQEEDEMAPITIAEEPLIGEELSSNTIAQEALVREELTPVAIVI